MIVPEMVCGRRHVGAADGERGDVHVLDGINIQVAARENQTFDVATGLQFYIAADDARTAGVNVADVNDIPSASFVPARNVTVPRLLPTPLSGICTTPPALAMMSPSGVSIKISPMVFDRPGKIWIERRRKSRGQNTAARNGGHIGQNLARDRST